MRTMHCESKIIVFQKVFHFHLKTSNKRNSIFNGSKIVEVWITKEKTSQEKTANVKQYFTLIHFGRKNFISESSAKKNWKTGKKKPIVIINDIVG